MASKKRVEKFSKGSLILISASALVVFLVIFIRLLSIKFTRNDQEIVGIPEVDTHVANDTNSSQSRFGNMLKIPESFPEDFPLYSDNKVVDAWSVQGESVEGISILLTTPDSPQRVIDYYKNELDSSGWEKGELLEADGSFTLAFAKNNVEGFVGITKGHQELTEISITVGIK
jgi:hypothetical protein